MRPTVVHLREAAIIVSVGLIAFAAIRVSDHLIGHDSPSLPGIISLIFAALCIFLLGRYYPRSLRPLDPRRQRIWFLSALGASLALGLFGLIAAVSMVGTYSEPSVLSCPVTDHCPSPKRRGDMRLDRGFGNFLALASAASNRHGRAVVPIFIDRGAPDRYLGLLEEINRTQRDRGGDNLSGVGEREGFIRNSAFSAAV